MTDDHSHFSADFTKISTFFQYLFSIPFFQYFFSIPFFVQLSSTHTLHSHSPLTYSHPLTDIKQEREAVAAAYVRGATEDFDLLIHAITKQYSPGILCGKVRTSSVLTQY